MMILLFKKYKTIWTKIEDLQNVELDALSVSDDRYKKQKKEKEKKNRIINKIKIIINKLKKYGDKVYTNFRRRNVP